MGTVIKDMRNKALPDLFEKKLIVARYFIKQKEKGKNINEMGIYNIWTNCFPKDFRLSKNRKFKLKNDGSYSLVLAKNNMNVPNKIISNYSNKWRKIYIWVTDYVANHNLDECDSDLLKLRTCNFHRLINTYNKSSNYFIKQGTRNLSSMQLATYHIFHNNKQYSGTYEDLMQKSNNIQVERL